jgi:hypothetical protein
MNNVVKIILILLCIVALYYLVVTLARSEAEEEMGGVIRGAGHPVAAVSGPWDGRLPARVEVEGAG